MAIGFFGNNEEAVDAVGDVVDEVADTEVEVSEDVDHFGLCPDMIVNFAEAYDVVDVEGAIGLACVFFPGVVVGHRAVEELLPVCLVFVVDLSLVIFDVVGE